MLNSRRVDRKLQEVKATRGKTSMSKPMRRPPQSNPFKFMCLGYVNDLVVKSVKLPSCLFWTCLISWTLGLTKSLTIYRKKTIYFRRVEFLHCQSSVMFNPIQVGIIWILSEVLISVIALLKKEKVRFPQLKGFRAPLNRWLSFPLDSL